MKRTRITGVFGGCILLLALAAPLALKADQPKPIEMFTGFAVSLGTGKANVIDITINRWSTDEEREMLLTTLQEFGQERCALHPDLLQRNDDPHRMEAREGRYAAQDAVNGLAWRGNERPPRRS